MGIICFVLRPIEHGVSCARGLVGLQVLLGGVQSCLQVWLVGGSGFDRGGTLSSRVEPSWLDVRVGLDSHPASRISRACAEVSAVGSGAWSP